MNYKRLLFVFLLIPFLCSCSKKTYTRSNLAFDTVVTVTLYEGGSEEILDEVFTTVSDLNQRFDPYNKSSEINQINTENTSVSEDVFSILESNLKYNTLTGGAVSPTLGRLIRVWDINEPEVKEAPSKEQVQEALIGTEIENLVLDPSTHSVTLKNALTEINLGASTKGFAADKIKEQLKNAGVTSALINLGGNVLALGKHNGEDFSIGIENPEKDSEEAIAVLKVSDKSVVTSGIYQRYFTTPEGKVYHHILDPKTGYPVESDLKEVVVVSDSSLEGDLLSTAFYVMGYEKSKEFLEEHKDFSAIFVYSNKILVSKNLETNFTLEPNYRNTFQVEYF